MSNRILGIGLLVVGVALIIIGLVWRGGTSAGVGIEATATTGVSATTTPTSTAAPAPTTVTTAPAPPPTTATTSTTTTTSTPPTTTTAVPPPPVEEFIAEYAAATESGNADFLFERLLPGIVDVLGADLCRGFVENEITAISDYRLTGMVSGPFARSLNVGDAQISVDDYYEAPVSFTFQGQSFDATATFAAVGGLVYWIGECR